MTVKTKRDSGDGDGATGGNGNGSGSGRGGGDGGLAGETAPATGKSVQMDPEFAKLLHYLRRTRGFDFAGYKHVGLARRFDKRMQMIGVQSYPAYVDYLEVHPDEFEHLFNTILINVTGFFRDSSVWDYLAAVVVPDILGRRSDADPIRVWSAGCASGEEAYSLAMLLADALGRDAFCDRVKIYATDVDEDALAEARRASYSAEAVEAIGPERRSRFFDQVNGRYTFDKELRRCVIFGRHDLFEDAPISRIDLLSCRNALMYFNAEAQAGILNRFHFALREHGYLFLGKAEMLLTHGNLFAPIDMRRRVFTKVHGADGRDRLLAMAQTRVAPGAEPANPERWRQAAIDAAPLAQLVVDGDGLVAAVNERARDLFGLGSRDVGRPLRDLEVSYRPLELRSILEQSTAERRAIISRGVDWSHPRGERLVLDVTVSPLPDHSGILGWLVSYADATPYTRLGEELRHAHEVLESTQGELQSTTEELETTNEELQSTVEELQTTNEELQSTNEELETMNEELQSTNEELNTSNAELRLRSDELNVVNEFLESILTSLRTSVIALDADLRVTAWNERSHDMWGMRADEVKGKHVLTLDVGFPVEQLKGPLRACVNGETEGAEVLLAARNRRGRAIGCKVTCAPLNGAGKDKRGVILLIEETEPAAATEITSRSAPP